MYNYVNETAKEIGEKLEKQRKKLEKLKSSKCASSPEEIAAGLKKAEAGYENIDILRTQPGDIVVAYFNMDEIDIGTAQEMHKALTGIMPDEVSVVTMPNCTQVLAYDKNQYAKEMLNNMYIGLGRDKYIEVLRDELDRIDGDDLK